MASSDWIELTQRLVLAMVVGAAIGWNRQKSGKSAGLRTHMLVSLGAALFVLIPSEIEGSQSADALSRTVQGVATGVGFLGAGEIFQQSQADNGRRRVKGMTSAAAIWVAAGLGAVVGCGLWQIGLVGMVLTLITLGTIKRMEQWTWIRRGRDDEEE
ncbi:MgtC/SapB family protein [Geitlerinema sp. PCC 7407]|uniref:MgtC/SapB family protein n=1 Tax=Geitlerinema sp. PCC 7407 TaxID=1173025 RepID=UPI00029FB182|nr:MgtC/SapB family protein [Geitlerinema sp. PCC 7407]AFY64581.1 MgtC/SapB transporter [Geitlerinema sp. PCC 7407]